MMSKKVHNQRVAERLSRTRSPAVEIIIESGAGSLLPYKEDRDVEATRRGLAAVRETSQVHRSVAETQLSDKYKDTPT